MAHLPALITDLALILIVGAFVTLLFRRIKQPLVLGYIIAGFLVGPHFQMVPTVVDEKNIDTLAEIGVIMLLFSLGLEFSFKKLMTVGGSASITAVVEIIFIGLGGYLTGYLLGWNKMDSLFLGGMLASSSTTIILKAFDELNMKTRQFAQIVFGVLIVEDIIVILLMVLLSTIAVTQQIEGSEILFTVLKLAFFLILWFLVGIYLLPSFLKRTRKLFDEETTLIFAVGLCFGMVILATQVGFSAELGAFVMGSIIAETTMAEKVEHVTKPLKQLFGTVFFVSVGMMIDPSAMVEYAGPILAITALTLFGKFFFSALGAAIAGQPLKQSIQVGMSMAQIGEFAFIVATLGLSLGVISEFLFPVAVGVSAITTFTTPYMIRLADPFYEWLRRNLPERFVQRIDNYSLETDKISANPRWQHVTKEYLRILVVNTIVLIAIILLFNFFITPLISGAIENTLYRNAVVILLATVVSAPFLWAILTKQPKSAENTSLSETVIVALNIVRFLLGTFLIGLFIDQITSTKYAILFALPLVVLLLWIFSKKIQAVYQRIEAQFLSNFHERETAFYQDNKTAVDIGVKNQEFKEKLKAWDAHIAVMEVDPLAKYVGVPLMELRWKETYGINVVYIKRGENLISLPGRSNRLLPYDKVGILGTDEQFQNFKSVFDEREEEIVEFDVDDIALKKILIDGDCKYIGKSIRESKIREELLSQVVGIEREGERILNPESSVVLRSGDILWMVGNIKKLREFILSSGRGVH
ncbi:cation:proton antiporter domain-containing protein [Planobacterium oryzisoli]|uniref:Cation:proton antiporter n=1 Tax=Planobacterium oryzisoli TaxID=2771435 RepID=A0A931EA64_9FLAO|nr:cation:proton antiporter [Planobacterium oryzisoli]MBF5027083.1 cation:proton antiporter [Planobacterium oryzisoli]